MSRTQIAFLIFGGACGLGLMGPSVVVADDLVVRLVVDEGALEAGASCFEAPDLEAQIEAILGRVVFASDAEARLQVVARAGSIALGIIAADGTRLAQRTLDGSLSCADRRGAVAVVAAVLLDTRARDVVLHVAPSERPRSETLPASPPASAASSHAVAGSADSTSAGPAIDVMTDVSAVGLFEWLPGFVVGTRIRGALGIDDWWVAPGIELFADSTAGEAPGVDVAALAGTLELITPRARAWRFGLQGAARVAVGVMRGQGINAMRTFARVRAAVRVELGLRGTLQVAGPFFVSLELGAGASLVRPVFRGRIGDDQVDLHQPFWVVPTGSVGIGLESE